MQTSGERLNGKWSYKYDSCISCGKIERKHKGHGLCVNCFENRKIVKISRVENVDEWEYQIILGSVLGDATLNFVGKNACFYETHCIKQEKYLLWKKDNAFTKFRHGFKYYPNKLQFWTEVSPLLTKLYHRIYINGKKTITKEILSELKPLGLAVWFMDDGSLGLNGGGSLATDCFSLNENILIKQFLDNLGVSCRIKKRNQGTYIIIINNQGFRELIKIIKMFVHPIFNYKIDINRSKEYMHQKYLNKKLNLIKINSEFQEH